MILSKFSSFFATNSPGTPSPDHIQALLCKQGSQEDVTDRGIEAARTVQLGDLPLAPERNERDGTSGRFHCRMLIRNKMVSAYIVIKMHCRGRDTLSLSAELIPLEDEAEKR